LPKGKFWGAHAENPGKACIRHSSRNRHYTVKLIGQKGPAQGNDWLLKGDRFTIGRDPTNDIYVADPKISRVHAEIVRREGQLYVVDNRSTNGTFLNGMRITEGVLREGMSLKVGNCEFTLTAAQTTDEFGWVEGTSSDVTASISLDALDKMLERTRSSLTPQRGIAAQKHETDSGDVAPAVPELARLVDHLHVIYDLSGELQDVRSRHDILDVTMKRLLKVFPKAERVCILTREEPDAEFTPARIHSNKQFISPEFRISRSIFQRALDDKAGIMATDASSDTRFSESDSIASLNLRSIICAPMIVKTQALGAVYLDHSISSNAFDADDLQLLVALARQAGMALYNAMLYENIQRAYHQSILALINTIEAKDPYTMGHTQRTMRYAVGIGKQMGLSESELHTLKTAAQLHDIGKIGVREVILTKDSALTDKEYADIQAHVEIGCRILQPIEYLSDIIPIVRGHHEKFDGSGYPDKVSGDAIALGARILGLADAFDAMTTQRPYNKPLSFQQALERCREVAGRHFDPVCVEALGRYLEESLSGNGADFSRPNSGTGASPAPVLTR